MEFSTEVIKIFDDLSKRLGVAIDWSNENIMPYLNDLVDRFIKWEIARSIFGVAISIVLIVVGICGIKYVWKNKHKYRYFGDLDEGITWVMIGAVLALVIGVLAFLFTCAELIEVIYLPEIAIYDYVQDLIPQ